MDATLYVGKVGKSVGLRGENRLIADTDFPEQFAPGARFETKRGVLEIEQFNYERGTVKFVGINSPEEAKKITNLELFTTKEATEAACELDEDEYYWYDVIGCAVYEGEQLLGEVIEIERLPGSDYLLIQTDKALLGETYKAKQFMVPYIDRYIVATDVEAKKVEVTGGLDLLEAS